MSDADFVREAGSLIGAAGSAFYFAPATLEAADQLGLDVLQLYYLGRGGVLGDVDARVVVSAFGFFRPDLVERMWAEGRRVIAPPDAAEVYFECSAALGRQQFGGLDLRPFCDAAEAVNRAVDPAALALYAGISALPLAADQEGRAMQLLTVLRELRGSAHLVALLACGMEPRVAHFVRRPDYFTVFGWGEDDVPVLSGDEERVLDEAEALTDRLLAPAFADLDDGARSTLISTLHLLADRLRRSGRALGVEDPPS